MIVDRRIVEALTGAEALANGEDGDDNANSANADKAGVGDLAAGGGLESCMYAADLSFEGCMYAIDVEPKGFMYFAGLALDHYML